MMSLSSLVACLFCLAFTFGDALKMEKGNEEWLHFHVRFDDVSSAIKVESRDQSKLDVVSKTHSATATVAFQNTISSNGWSKLEISTSSYFSNRIQAYSAGYGEGIVTKSLITNLINNQMKNFCQSMTSYCKKLYDYFDENMEFMKTMIKKNANDSYWQQVYLLLLQAQGLQDAYDGLTTANFTIRLKPFSLILVNAFGDMETLETVLNDQKEEVMGAGSCSALVKILPDFKDVFVSHDTWSPYNTMLRIIKKISLNFHDQQGKMISGHTASFSSQPGSLFSGDDFYVLSSRLVALETTIGNSNASLWTFITPRGSVLEWIRNVVANRLAADGKEWCEIFSRYNSGTYNNQWMVVDYDKFTPGHNPLPAFLHVLEQLPGMIVWRDLTSVLVKQTYWPSYNSPYFDEIFNASGGQENVKKYGDWFSYDKTPRALIFARNHTRVTNMSHMINLMRFNDFQHDPLSACNCTPPYSGENSIAARSDLNPRDGVYELPVFGFRNHGATDMKVTSYRMSRKYEMIAECGPTHDQQPVFKWSDIAFLNITHEGMPDVFDFDPVHITWQQ